MTKEGNQGEDFKFDFNKFSEWKKNNKENDFYGMTIKFFIKENKAEVSQLSEFQSVDDSFRLLMITLKEIIPRVSKYNQVYETVIRKFCSDFINNKL